MKFEWRKSLHGVLHGMQWLDLFHSPSDFVLSPPQVVDLTQNQGTVTIHNIITLVCLDFLYKKAHMNMMVVK